jgi:hypothetical protein
MVKIPVVLYKTLIVGVIVLFIGVGNQSAIGLIRQEEEKNDVEIEIYAGQFLKKDIGFGISIYVTNHKTEKITLNIKKEYDFIFRDNRDKVFEFNSTIRIHSLNFREIFIPVVQLGIKYITITVNAEGTIVTRTGISINRIMIFTE